MTRLSRGVLGAALGIMAAGLLVGCKPAPPPVPLPIIGSLPDFSLIDHDGKPISRRDLEGKVWVADLIFTYCAGPCPLMSQKMSELQKAVGDLQDVRFVSFSVDPERDTPEVLRAYAKRYDAKLGQWIFVTGDRRKIHDLAINGFKLTVEDPRDDNPLLHSTHFMLVDRQGRLRGAFDGMDEQDFDRLIRAVRQLERKKDG